MRDHIVFCEITYTKRSYLKTIRRTGEFVWTSKRTEAKVMTHNFAYDCAVSTAGGLIRKVKEKGK